MAAHSTAPTAGREVAHQFALLWSSRCIHLPDRVANILPSLVLAKAKQWSDPTVPRKSASYSGIVLGTILVHLVWDLLGLWFYSVTPPALPLSSPLPSFSRRPVYRISVASRRCPGRKDSLLAGDPHLSPRKHGLRCGRVRPLATARAWFLGDVLAPSSRCLVPSRLSWLLVANPHARTKRLQGQAKGRRGGHKRKNITRDSGDPKHKEN
jgi:hypothetical protein